MGGYVTVLDSGSQMCKSRPLVNDAVFKNLVNQVASLRDPDLSLYPLIWGHTRVLSSGGVVGLDTALDDIGVSMTTPFKVAADFWQWLEWNEIAEYPANHRLTYWRRSIDNDDIDYIDPNAPADKGWMAYFDDETDGEDQSQSARERREEKERQRLEKLEVDMIREAAEEEEWKVQREKQKQEAPKIVYGGLRHIDRLAIQSLPCEVRVDEKGHAAITSYINNIHPQHHRAMYETIEKLISLSLRHWGEVLLQHQKPKKTLRVKPSKHLKDIKFDPAATDMEYMGPYKIQPYPQMGDVSRYEDWAAENDTNEAPLSEQLFNRDLQVIVDLSGADLYPPSRLHKYQTLDKVDGRLNEHIVASTMMYFDSENVTDESGSMSFNSQVKWNPDDPAMHAMVWTCKTAQGRHFRQGMMHDGVQKLPRIELPDGVLLSYSNALMYRVSGFDLADKAQAGRRRCIKLHLVDPNYRICSTRNVPPQQLEWVTRHAMKAVRWSRWGVSGEIIHLIAEWLKSANKDADLFLSEHGAKELNITDDMIQQSVVNRLVGRVMSGYGDLRHYLATVVYKDVPYWDGLP